MMRCATRPLMTVVLVAVTATATAAEGPLEAIPQSAGALIRLKKPNATVQKVVDFANEIDPQFGPTVFQFSQAIGSLISNPAKIGIDPDGHWWVAAFPVPKGEPGILFAIPASDAEAMKQAVGQQYKFLEHENWLLYSNDQATVDKVRKRLEGTGKSIASHLDGKSQTLFDQGDLSLYLNVDQLKKTYEPQLEQAEQRLEKNLENLSEQPSEVPGLDQQALAEIVSQVPRALLQALKDLRAATVAVSVQAERIGIEEYARVSKGSQTDEFLQKQAPSALSVLNELPADQHFYGGLHANLSGLFEWIAQMMPQLEKAAEKQGQQTHKYFQNLRKMLDGYAELEFGELAGSFGLGDLEGGALRSVGITSVQPIEKMQRITRQGYQAMNDIDFNGYRQTVEVKTDAEKYGQYSADLITVDQHYEESADPKRFMKEFNRILYGPKGMQQRIIYMEDQNRMVQTAGGGREFMKQVLGGLQSQSSSSQSASGTLQASRNHLLPKANLLALVDLPGLVADGLTLAVQSKQVPLPLDEQSLNELNLDRSYLGFSVATEAQGLRAKTHVPARQIQGFVTLFRLYQKQQQLGPPGQ